MTNRIGQRFGNYRLIHLIGQGGFAEVYLGEHVFLRTRAAIKVLLTRLTTDDRGSFLNEARTIASLDHPHIVRVLEFGVEGEELNMGNNAPNAENSTPFLAMDYAPNGTLRQRYPKGTRLPLTAILSYVEQVAGALQYAHHQKLIHRDIKPENMLIGRNNEILLSDFGIALVAQSSRNQNNPGVVGTLPYMAPEQMQRRPSFASDQYALGIIVYEWLCGVRPFYGSFNELVTQHIFASPPLLREKVPEISLAVEEVVLRTLAKDPQRRFVSVQAFANALVQACRPQLSGSPHTAPVQSQTLTALSNEYLSTPAPTLLVPPTLDTSTKIFSPTSRIQSPTGIETPSRLPDSFERRFSRRLFIRGLAGLAALGGGAIWLTVSRRSVSTRTPTATSTAIRTASSTSSTQGNTLFVYRGHSDGVNSVAWSPDGNFIASGSGREFERDHTAQTWDATTGNHVYTYRGHSYWVQSVAWSPNSKRIVSASITDSGATGATVQVWDFATGNHVLNYRGLSTKVAAWSPDGTRIASASEDGTVQIWDAATGSKIYTYHGHPYGEDTLAWSPDSKLIASGGADSTVQIWDAATGSKIYTYRGHPYGVYTLAWSPDGKHIASGGGSTSNQNIDGIVQVWEATTGSHILTYHGNTNFVFALAWSPNGKHIASTGEDTDVKVWDAASGSNTYIYSEHSDGVSSIAWSPDSTRIASGSGDKTVRVWLAV